MRRRNGLDGWLVGCGMVDFVEISGGMRRRRRIICMGVLGPKV